MVDLENIYQEIQDCTAMFYQINSSHNKEQDRKRMEEGMSWRTPQDAIESLNFLRKLNIYTKAFQRETQKLISYYSFITAKERQREYSKHWKEKNKDRYLKHAREHMRKVRKKK